MAQQKNGRGHEMDLLKSILETEGDSQVDKEDDHVRLHLPSMSIKPAPKMKPVSPKHHPSLPKKRDVQESDTDASSLESELWMQREINKAYQEIHAREQQDSPHGSSHGSSSRKKRGRKKQSHKYNGVLTHSDMLENKYQELRSLLTGHSVKEESKLDPQLVHQTRQLVKQFEVAGGGHIPVERILGKPVHHHDDEDNNDSHSTQTDPPSWKPNRMDDDNTYILIDGTGNNVRTRRVTFKEEVDEEDDPSPQQMRKPPVQPTKPPRPAPRRSRPTRRARPSSAVKKTSQSKSPARKSSPKKSSKSRDSSSSDSYTSDFSSRSRSRSSSGSRSRSRSVENRAVLDHHLKTTDNPKLQDWLKQKNREYRLQRKEERKKRREERKKAAAEAEEKESKKQVSEQRVRKWMSEKRKQARLLRRERIAQGFVSDPSVQSESTINGDSPQLSDRSSTTQQKSSNRSVPKYKHEKPLLTDLSRKSRPLSASFVYTQKKSVKQRPSSSRPATKPTPVEELSEEAKRASYNEWVAEKEEAEESHTNSENKPVPVDGEKPPVASKQRPRKGSAGDYTLPRQNATSLPLQSQVMKGSDSPKSEPSSPSHPSFAIPHPPRPSVSSPLPPKVTPPPSEEPAAAAEPPSGISPEQETPQKDIPPRPATSMSSRRVKYTEKSWENFADHVWEKLNEDGQETVKNGNDDTEERPEPQGSDCPDDAPFCESEGASLSSDPPSPDHDAELEKLKDDDDEDDIAEQTATLDDGAPGNGNVEKETEKLSDTGESKSEMVQDSLDVDDGAKPGANDEPGSCKSTIKPAEEVNAEEVAANEAAAAIRKDITSQSSAFLTETVES